MPQHDIDPQPDTTTPTPQLAPSRATLRGAVADLESLPSQALRTLASELEEAGMVTEAVRVVRRLVEREPRDASAWVRLASLHLELGDLPRAARCRQRATALGAAPPPGDSPDGALVEDSLGFTSADIERFLDLFAGREDHHARQWANPSGGRGGYSPVEGAPTATALRKHLKGSITLGTYVLRSDGRVGFVCFDLDARRAAFEAARGDAARVESLRRALDAAARSLCGALGQLGIPFILEDSGQKGRHLWVFLDRPVPAAEAREFGEAFAAAHAPTDERLHIEVFPKQGALGGKGLGNLVKLPLGIHRVSGRRSVLLRADGTPEPRPARALRRVGRVAGATLQEATARLATRPAQRSPTDTGDQPRRQRTQPWTEAELAADEQFGAVLAGCPVLRRLVDRALAGDALAHHEIVAIEYTLGHLDHGSEGVNLLLSKVPGVPAERRLGRRHSGQPTSCSKLRRRLVGIAARVGCRCDFGPRLPTYPNPLLHLSGPGGVVVRETED